MRCHGTVCSLWTHGVTIRLSVRRDDVKGHGLVDHERYVTSG